MKAFVYSKYGGLKNLVNAELPKPVPRPDEVLVAVKAVSINDWDMAMMDGSSWFNRLLSGITKPKYPVLGSDIAGVVEAVGSSVQQLRIGDRVYGDLSGQWGGFATHVCCRENKLALMPAGMSYIQAAALPQAGELAIQGLIDEGGLTAGKEVLINGAGGGVGTIGIQIAKIIPVQVDVVDRKEKLDLLHQMGAGTMIDYLQHDFTALGKKYDLILDTKTNRPFWKYLKVLKPAGRYVTVGGSIGRLLVLLVIGKLLPMFSSKRIRIVALKANKDLHYMNQLFTEGKLVPVIDGPFAFEEIPRAMRVFMDGQHKGKMLISISK